MPQQPVRILTYKRTHTGDPDNRGRFGIRDCMGRVRDLDFDAVIGVGGTSAEPERCGIARKLTWIGIGPRRTSHAFGRAGLVEFDHFVLFDSAGPELISVAPHLARLMYGRNRRFVLDRYPEAAYAEALQLLELARQDADVADPDARRGGRRCRATKLSVRRKSAPLSPSKVCHRLAV